MSEKLPKGFTCECGTYSKYPVHMYAHWRDIYTYTCKECGAKYEILMGRADRIPDE